MRLLFKTNRLVWLALCLLSLQGSAQQFNKTYFAKSLAVDKSTYAVESASLEIGDSATKKGLRLPRVARPDSVKNAVSGLMVYSLYDQAIYYRIPSGWMKLCACGTISDFSITTHPVSASKTLGQNITFTVATTGGTTPITYQWYKDDLAITGATSISYTLIGLDADDGGTYKVRVTSSNEPAIVLNSNDAILTVVTIPFIYTLHPADQTVDQYAPYSLTATVANGTGDYTWRWYIVGSSTPISTTVTSVPTKTQYVGGSNSDIQWFVTCTTTANGIITSDTANITVTPLPVVTYGYASVDPYISNSSPPSIGSSAVTTIAHNADISISFPAAAVDKFIVFKVPATEPVKVTWFSTSLNNGSIPDAAFRAPFTIAGFTYYVTRDAAGLAFDYTVPIQLKQ